MKNRNIKQLIATLLIALQRNGKKATMYRDEWKKQGIGTYIHGRSPRSPNKCQIQVSYINYINNGLNYFGFLSQNSIRYECIAVKLDINSKPLKCLSYASVKEKCMNVSHPKKC